MSENEQIMEMLNRVLKELEELKQKALTQSTIPKILTQEDVLNHYKMSYPTQAKYRTSKHVKDHIPYTNVGGIRYKRDDFEAWLERNQQIA